MRWGRGASYRSSTPLLSGPHYLPTSTWGWTVPQPPRPTITSTLVLLSSVFAIVITICLEALGWGAVVRGGGVLSCASSRLVLCERWGEGSHGWVGGGCWEDRTLLAVPGCQLRLAMTWVYPGCLRSLHGKFAWGRNLKLLTQLTHVQVFNSCSCKIHALDPAQRELGTAQSTDETLTLSMIPNELIATCSYWELAMPLVWLRNCILHLTSTWI